VQTLENEHIQAWNIFAKAMEVEEVEVESAHISSQRRPNPLDPFDVLEPDYEGEVEIDAVEIDEDEDVRDDMEVDGDAEGVNESSSANLPPSTSGGFTYAIAVDAPDGSSFQSSIPSNISRPRVPKHQPVKDLQRKRKKPLRVRVEEQIRRSKLGTLDPRENTPSKVLPLFKNASLKDNSLSTQVEGILGIFYSYLGSLRVL
jgi:hypothetical protein